MFEFVNSQNSVKELIEDILCAKNAFDNNFTISLEFESKSINFSSLTHFLKKFFIRLTGKFDKFTLLFLTDPMIILSGCSKFFIADPSAKNSGMFKSKKLLSIKSSIWLSVYFLETIFFILFFIFLRV